MTAKKKKAQQDSPSGHKTQDAATPSDVPPSFPVVGIGASAGGLAAFEAFFSGMPTDAAPGMAFVLVQHLAPDHKSMLTELIRRYTKMQVFEVEDGMTVQPNCTYIIPPNHDMALLNGKLQLLEPVAPHGQRLPIDFFFRSLAEDQHERAIAVVLSGTGSDGTLGIRAIKGEGGMVMAQTPNSTEYDGMPRGAINTGLVDYELPPAEMAAQLIAYASHAFKKHHPPKTSAATDHENAIRKIFILLRVQTGHDFSQYKPNTIHRRIERRMAVHQVSNISDYVKFLQQSPEEVEALFRDILIGVTSFFRDPQAFNALEEKIIPGLFADKPSGGIIRVWVAGCSTGEEAYSIAILLQEQLDELKQNYRIQIFATDMDSRSIATARTGSYPASIAESITPERLKRFFVSESAGEVYRVHKRIRDLLIFSEQDIIKDPPFSKLDLICCRNLLIYMGAELQRKIIPLFHYALNPNGILFLGTSETVGDSSTLFSTLDRKAKLYQRKEDIRGIQQAAIGRLILPATATETQAPPLPATDEIRSPQKRTPRQLTEQALLQHVIQAGILVDAQGDILYLHGRTGTYLEPAQGESGTNNILKMAREGLRRNLATTLHKAVTGHCSVSSQGLRVKTNSHFTMVNLTICPVPTNRTTPRPPLFLVILEDAGPSDQPRPPLPVEEPTIPPEANARIKALTQELRAKEEFLQTTNEELETSNEELKSSNEEMQSINEELQSSNEELETSKEELQSVNEELTTVNTELQTKVADLSRVNNDMNNLLAGTGIGTVFVDHQLRILRFTPAVTRIINLIQGDIGRPINHIVSNLIGYERLFADIESVLSTLIPVEVEVQSDEGKWYTMRIQPYRTIENVIEGAVITFFDITTAKAVQTELQQASEQLGLAALVRDASDAMVMYDLDGNIILWNPAAEKMYEWTAAEAQKMNVRDLVPQELKEKELAKLKQLGQNQALASYETKRIAKNGTHIGVWLTSTVILNERGAVYAIATIERAAAEETAGCER
jgi:two-component system CheB/CheR fusion protein